jgi:signal transduction histidine kinase/ligand-binding sensor domain-containing protein/DNA-binding response OmpR family regulator
LFYFRLNIAIKIILLSFFLLLPKDLFSKSFTPLQSQLKFISPVGIEKLSQIVINDMIQDTSGFMWIATSDGLNRYDGYDVKSYRYNSTTKSLSHFYITALLTDQQDQLWVGTENGLNLYNRKQDNFTRFNVNNTGSIKLSNLRITKLLADSQNRIWVGTRRNGVIVISSNRKNIQQFKNLEAESNSLSNNYIESIFEDSNNRIWIGTRNGLNKYVPKSKSFEKFTPHKFQPSNSKNNSVISLYQTSLSHLLVGTRFGLKTFNINKNKFYDLNIKELDGKKISNIISLDNNEILVGTRNNGLYHLNENGKLIKTYTNNSQNEYSIPSNQILATFKSKNGLVWIGTNLGVKVYDPSTEIFRHYKANTQIKDCLAGDVIFAISHGNAGNLWIAIEGKGLNKVDLLAGECEFMTVAKTSLAQVTLNSITSLYEDANDFLWIGTYESGLLKLNQKNGKFEYYFPDDNDSKSINSLEINAIDGDGLGNVWIATYGGGLNYYNSKTNDFTNYVANKSDPNSISTNLITDVEVAKNGNVWAATQSKGLEKFNIKTNSFSHYVRETMDSDGIPFTLRSVKEDMKGNIWTGSRGYGAFVLNQKTNEVNKFDVNNGIVDNTVLSIEVDNNNGIWLYSDGGLTKLEINSNKITNYNKSDGLQSNFFTTASFYNPKRDEMLTGGINGFNQFSPQELSSHEIMPRPTITSFELFNQPVNKQISDPSSPLLINITEMTELILEHDQNVISFGFTGMLYTKQKLITYYYILEGNTSDWVEVDSDKRFASFTNLPPGDYTFRVKAVNRNGRKSEQNDSVNITIKYPWWQTKIAYIIFVITVLSAIFLYIKARTRSLTIRSRELEISVAERTRELATEKQKVEQLLSKKNEEFANVSHEFRTPLTLILGPLAQVIKTNKNPDEVNRLNIVQRNSYRLLRMVDQLLNLETFRIKSITQKSPQATGQIIKRLAEAFIDLTNEKGIELKLGNIENINFEFTNDALEKIVVNLLSNAFKYTLSNGRIEIHTERTTNNELLIQIEDTGIGIPADKIDSIFERYTRILDKNSEQITGAGIGLALVKNLVEAHDGIINIESEVGVGTTTTVTLPIINEVNFNKVITHTNHEIIAMELMGITSQSSMFSEEPPLQSFESNSGKPNVLVIEDNQDMRNYIVEQIKNEYQILTANDGLQGFNLAVAEVPDLIISDIMMPNKNGYQLTHELRHNPITNHIPIILLTARDDRESRLKGWYEQADEYLTKPFDVEELKIRLSNLLGIRNILKKRFSEIAFQTKNSFSEKINLPTISSETEKQSTEYLQTKFISQLNTIVEKHYLDSALSVSTIASDLAMSERQFLRKLKSIVDMTPIDYLRRFRIEKGRALLVQGKSASYATVEIGFTSQSYFGKCFKAQYGITPSQFKKTLKN